jgi:hypothetical protein
MASTSARCHGMALFCFFAAAATWIERLRGDIGSQHLGQLVILEATFQEFLLSEASVVVFVHPGIEVERNYGFKGAHV